MALVLGAAAPAQAQFLGYWGWRSGEVREVVPAPVIYRGLIRRGYRVVSALQRNGGVYLADVRDRRGHRQRLVLDAYSGAVLQSFSFGPPRPMAAIPDLPRGYERGPVYASRYPPDEVLPTEREPHLGLPQGLRGPLHEGRVKHPTRKLARREITPPKPAFKRHEPLASHATREPIHRTPDVLTNTGANGAAAKTNAPQKKASAPHDTQTAAVPGAVSAAPHPAAVPTKPAQKPINRPGFANGVPINPLD